MAVGAIGFAFAQINGARVGVFEGIHKLPSFRQFERIEWDFVPTVLAAVLEWGKAQKLDLLSVIRPVGPKGLMTAKLVQAGFVGVETEEGQLVIGKLVGRCGVALPWDVVRQGSFELATSLGCSIASLPNRFFCVFKFGTDSSFVKFL